MRKAGILLPLSALPSAHGIGTLGRTAYNFVDFLAAAGQSLWQILPIGPTGYGDSPYQSFSAFAGNPYAIDLNILKNSGLLSAEEIGAGWGDDPARVDYGLLFERRFGVLALAVSRQDKAEPAYRAFCADNAHWLEDYALYMAVKEANGQKGFQSWPEALRRRNPLALKAARSRYATRVEFWRCVQYFFFSQWKALKRYANARGVGIVGDIPIYVSDDSSDLWANPELFLLDAEGRPAEVAGVPPDGFSANGQLWGNPLYDWPAHRRTKYAWWLRRLSQAAELFDITRIDHFRGFAGYFAVPAGHTTAKTGRWRKGPGVNFIRAAQKALPDIRIIAEDLGFLTSEVHELLAISGYPGMKVLQFAFDSREESDYLPHNYQKDTVVYTGTHDNTTSRAWAKEAAEGDVAFARRYLGLSPRGSMAKGMVRAALASVADTAVIPMQDWLDLPATARFNTPATLGGNNWCWRLTPGQLTPDLAAEIRLVTRTYGRLSAAEREQQRMYAALAARVKAREGLPLPGAVAMAAEKQVSMNADEAPAQSGSGAPAPGAEANTWVLTAAEMKAAEAAAVEAGTSYEELMENAGTAAALGLEALAEKHDTGKRVLLLCGKGNNAGDAFVVARLLAAKGWKPQLLLLFKQGYSELARLNLERVPGAVPRVDAESANWNADFIVDGVFGTGFHGRLPEKAAEALGKANKAKGMRVALDLPSGLDCDTGEAAPDTFKAAHTFTFGAFKPALLMEGCAQWVGEAQVLDIGL